MRFFFTQQSLFRARLHRNYFGELAGVDLLNLKDKQGNVLTLYESDYNKMQVYLKSQQIESFTDLTIIEKLEHLEKANVRVTRYFSEENLKRYELDVNATLATDLTDIFCMDGSALIKGGHQNCLVIQDNRIYICPKIRCVTGAIDDEVLLSSEPDVAIKKGTIGHSHSSLSSGHEVSFAGSVVHEKDGTWQWNNLSGHYVTDAYQMRALVTALQDKGMDLSKLTLKIWILKAMGIIPPVIKEEDYEIFTENAADYMNRMQDAQIRYQVS
ncbi:MAG: hypothetical protein P4L79_01085 [Legionella sp.]|uniref:hypothetical protein n=1 Tax=Legionella sp. TaxID=459 RepID=UPI00284618BC|nr:hypothetical protein [Legionella sp.]